ncbi:histidine kinase [Achromobacter sp. RTa]|uniref:EAL domain-containing response regulator n=1 Tax=Achromobacter sp. RTa TaxID=1532557 RepID=UPI00050F522F|nr:EAL domain-containing response regulator [Achromobacter sp. RTa]KGD93466.1 histidine kinase [Achromobacter sp. RTa]
MLSAYKVLVLDDHAFQCAHLKDMLEEAGFSHVDTLQSAGDALRSIRDDGYNLVVMDVNMPVMDGAQFIHELARQDLTPMLAIVTGCSRRMANSISLMAKEKGLAVLGAFVKPVSHEQIDSLAAGLLRKTPAGAHFSAPRTDCASSLLDRHSLESALRDGSIRAWFQPKKSLSSGQIVGAEALVRWQHQELGLMMPSSFLKTLRDYGLDHDLLIRMLEDGLKAYRTWRGQGYRIPISINLPTSLLDRPQLPDELYYMVTNSGLPAEDVTFELLEDDMTVGAGQYYMGTSRLRLKGFGLSQDDFGKGYSTMYSLISTPFTELKIDRAFVCGAAKDEVRAAALVSSVQLGRQLGLQVTAEGVETMQDLQFVRQIGCDYAQGYLISAAVDVSAFSRLLANEPNPYFSTCTPPH